MPRAIYHKNVTLKRETHCSLPTSHTKHHMICGCTYDPPPSPPLRPPSALPGRRCERNPKQGGTVQRDRLRAPERNLHADHLCGQRGKCLFRAVLPPGHHRSARRKLFSVRPGRGIGEPQHDRRCRGKRSNNTHTFTYMHDTYMYTNGFHDTVSGWVNSTNTKPGGSVDLFGCCSSMQE